MDVQIVAYVILATSLTGVICDTGYFWHVTDFHYDFTYHDRQWSCNDAHKSSNPGQFGDFWCDSPWSLVNSSVKAMARIKDDVDFLLWTGDTVLHGKDTELSYDINADILDNVTDILKTSFPGKSVYASFGNHDYWPNNQFPPYNNALYNATLERWRQWINDPSQDENFRKGAYYTAKIQPRLRVIALNTNLYYTSNKATVNVSDPGDQLQWLNNTLRSAFNNQEKVLITAHIPPGVHTPNGLVWMHTKYHEPLVQILREHADNIVGMHFGHDHSDGFKIFPDQNGNPAAPIFIAPSVTPWRYVIPTNTGPAHNPGVRLVSYDRVTGKHLEIYQYYLDLVSANEKGTDDWVLEYNSSSVYGLTELTASSLKDLSQRMTDSSSSEFKNYWKFYTVSPPADLLEACNEECHASVVCGFSEFDMDKFTSCKTNMVSSATYVCINIIIMFLSLFIVSLYNH